MTNTKGKNTMQVKKIVAGTYAVIINDVEFEIYQNLTLIDKGWELRNVSNDREWIDTFSALCFAKQYLAEHGYALIKQENA